MLISLTLVLMYDTTGKVTRYFLYEQLESCLFGQWSVFAL